MSLTYMARVAWPLTRAMVLRGKLAPEETHTDLTDLCGWLPTVTLLGSLLRGQVVLSRLADWLVGRLSGWLFWQLVGRGLAWLRWIKRPSPWTNHQVRQHVPDHCVYLR